MADLDKSNPVSLEELMVSTLASQTRSLNCSSRRASAQLRSSHKSCWRSGRCISASEVDTHSDYSAKRPKFERTLFP
jgi:hypothetical protein